MPTCLHHVQWLQAIPGGMHQCVQCMEVVLKKDIYPKFDDLPEEFRRRWDTHEARREPASEPAPEGTKP